MCIYICACMSFVWGGMNLVFWKLFSFESNLCNDDGCRRKNGKIGGRGEGGRSEEKEKWEKRKRSERMIRSQRGGGKKR